MRLTTSQRFWSKVLHQTPNKCWNWIGYINQNGYGRFYYNGKTETSSRVSYILEHGNFDRRLHVLHNCDNRRCVNPGHLFLGTNRDNVLDMLKKGRHRSGQSSKKFCPQNHKYSKSNTILINTQTKFGAGIERRCKKCVRKRHWSWKVAKRKETGRWP